MSKARPPRERRLTAPDPSMPRLTPDGAFVVQLEPPPPTGRRILRGRVEHLASGEARRFGSLAELVGFMSRLRGGGE
jgi:hypothetical protein